MIKLHSSQRALYRPDFLVWLVVIATLLLPPLMLEAAEVKGKVVQIRDSTVIIRLQNTTPVSRGDRVDLSFNAAGDVIAVGTWKVSAIKDDGTIEAQLVEALAEPTINLDALIHLANERNENTVATDTEVEHPAPPPENLSRKLPEILGRSDARRDFSELGELTACDKGKIIRSGNRLEMHSTGKKKNAGKQCSVRISNGPLENLHASVRMKVDSKDFLVGLFFGNLADEGGRKGSIFMLEGAVEGSILMTIDLMTTKGSTGFWNKKNSVVSSSWISAYDTAGNTLADRKFNLQAGFFNPTPGTMEFIKTGKLCRLLWNGEEMASWEMESSVPGEVRLAYAQVGWKKGKATFDEISVQRLDLQRVP